MVLLAMGCAASTVRAATMSASVDEQSFTKGVPFQVNLRITGGTTSRIDLPDLDGATVDPKPSYSSKEIYYENGVMSAAFSVGYMVTPSRAGELLIPSFKAEVDGEIIESQPFRVTVEEGPKATDSTARSVAGDQNLFIQIKTDKEEAYQGEAITLTMEVWIYERLRGIQYDPTGFPELTGFYALPRDPHKEAERTDFRDGRRYSVVPFVQYLYPTTSGQLRVGPWTWNCAVGFPIRARNVTVKTDPFSIRVKPLPAPPSDFSGSVGTYQVFAEVTPQVTDVGVPAILAISVQGKGNPDAIGTPRLPSLDGVYIDEPKRSNLAPGPDGLPTGERFDFKLTPQRPGDIRIPPVSYVYFDPEQRSYQTTQTGELLLRVRGMTKREDQVIVGGGSSEPTAPSQGTDILPLSTDPGPLARRGDMTIPTALGYATPVVAYLALALYVRRRNRFAHDRAFARAYSALKSGIERLDAVRESGNSVDALYHAVTGFIADEFNLPETGMTSAEAQLLFDARGIHSDVATGFVKILKTCERARYAAAELSPDEIGALIEGARAGMYALNDELRRRRPR